jgi:hypothetical protein
VLWQLSNVGMLDLIESATTLRVPAKWLAPSWMYAFYKAAFHTDSLCVSCIPQTKADTLLTGFQQEESVGFAFLNICCFFPRNFIFRRDT